MFTDVCSTTVQFFVCLTAILKFSIVSGVQLVVYKLTIGIIPDQLPVLSMVYLIITYEKCDKLSLFLFFILILLLLLIIILFKLSAGSGEEDGNESFDDSEARRRLEDYEGGTAASAAASDHRPEVAARGGAGNSLEPASDSADENGAPQDEQVQAAAAEGHLHNGQVNLMCCPR